TLTKLFVFAGWYSCGSFYLVKCITEIVPLLITNFFYVYICNHYEAIKPGIYWNFSLVLLIATLAYQSMGHIMAIATRKSIHLLVAVSIHYFVLSILLSDFLILHHR